MSRTHYHILGVDRNASQDEIKSAYRRQARTLHPDQSGKSSGPFLEIQEAYSVLGDPVRRRAYDRSLQEPSIRVDVHYGPPPGRPASPPAEPLIPTGAAEPLIPTNAPPSGPFPPGLRALFRLLNGP